jgi:hypothetical protein
MSEPLKKVPEWNEYYPSLSNATAEQFQFYRFWVGELEKGNFIDIDGNLSYIFVYLYSVIQHFAQDKDINRLLERFDNINKGYSEYKKIKGYLMGWTSDAYLYLQNYDKAWETGKGKRLNICDIINFRAKCSDTSIDGQDLISLLQSDNGLTPFGTRHLAQIVSLATTSLRKFHIEHGKNFIEHFCDEFDFSCLTESDFVRLKEFYSNEKDFFFWKKIYERDEKARYPYIYAHFLFSGVPVNIPCLECKAVPYIVTVALINEAKKILRECENIVREEKHLPKVGEGWISETELFHRLCEEFPNEKIVHHGRPNWLSPQHIDIYFPVKNIGIEYQGAQHQNPVEYFGGKEAFLKQQKLDAKKKLLCEKHKCRLIYFYEESNFEDIKQKIKYDISETG